MGLGLGLEGGRQQLGQGVHHAIDGIHMTKLSLAELDIGGILTRQLLCDVLCDLSLPVASKCARSSMFFMFAITADTRRVRRSVFRRFCSSISEASLT